VSGVKQDCAGNTISISQNSKIVRVDGIPICKRVIRKDGVYLQFADRDKQRSGIRGTRYVEVRLDSWINKIA
jgi:hypothetical protein